MHGATLALINPGGFAHDFGHQCINPGPFTNRVTVGAMVADHVIICPQRHAGADYFALLANR